MLEIRDSVRVACSSMAYQNVKWDSPTSYEYDCEESTEQEGLALVGNLGDGISSYLDFAARIFGVEYKHAVKLPNIVANRHSMMRVKRASRASRPAVRQTFATRKAAKAADSGGGSSDPDGRRPHTETNTRNTCNTFSAISAFPLGGTK